MVRRIGLILLSFAAVAVFFVLAPKPSDDAVSIASVLDYSTLVDIALQDFEANAANTESAPQQQVVNGWVTRDLLQIQALVLNDILAATSQVDSGGQIVASFDERMPALLVILVLAVGFIGATPGERVRTIGSSSRSPEVP